MAPIAPRGRYFALFSLHIAKPSGLAREIRTEDGLRYEAFGRNGRWNRANSLLGTLRDGDAIPISREEAMAMLSRRGAEPDSLDQGARRGP